MNAAIAISALLFGGWVLPGKEAAEGETGIRVRTPAETRSRAAVTDTSARQTPGTTAVPPPSTQLPWGYAPPTPGAGQAAPGYGQQRSAPGQGTTLSPWYRGGTAADYGQGREMLMPLAPTDPDAASQTYPWGPPTADEMGDEQDLSGGRPILPTKPGQPGVPYGSPPLGNPEHRVPASPYAMPSRSRPQHRGNPSRGQQALATQQARERAAGGGAYSAAAGAADMRAMKPFNSYNTSPAVSPYMNLFRRDSGVVDNYNSLVRPQLDQMQANQQVGGQINSISSRVRRNAAAVGNLGKDARRLQRIPSSDYYMNYGNYFPGFNR